MVRFVDELGTDVDELGTDPGSPGKDIIQKAIFSVIFQMFF